MKSKLRFFDRDPDAPKTRLGWICVVCNHAINQGEPIRPSPRGYTHKSCFEPAEEVLDAINKRNDRD